MQGRMKTMELVSDFDAIKFKDRLTTSMLLQMAIRLTFIVILVAGATYWHITTIYETQVVETLEKYIKERSDKESLIFELAAENHQVFKNNFIDAFNSNINVSDNEFTQRFITQQDGTTRLQAEAFYGLSTAQGDQLKNLTGYIGSQAPIEDQTFRNKVNISYHLLAQYGPAWTNRFESLYVAMPENVALLYWPELPWGLDAEPQLDITKEQWYTIATQENNPQRSPVWTGLYFDKTAKDWMVSLETPVDLNSQHLITIGHDILLVDVIDRIIHDKLEGTYNFLVSVDGQIIVHPNDEKIMKSGANELPTSTQNDPHLKSMINKIITASQQTDENVLINFDETEQAWMAIARINGPDWLLVTVYPKKLVITAARSTAHFVLIIGLLSLIVEMLMLYFVTLNKVVNPLKMFGRASAEIGQANYQLVARGDLELPSHRKDEMGILANVFKSMAGRIFEYSTTLEQKVSERTSELVESHKRAEIASKAKSNFLAHMSHEVRTPMNAIIGLSQLMLKTSLDKRQRDFMEKVLSSSDVLLNTINDVLDYSKIEANKLTLDEFQFDLRDVLRRVTNISAYKAQSKGVELLLDVDEKVPFHWIGDPTRLGQILINLASNAVKFTEKGEVVIRVKLLEQQGQLSTLRFSIIDTGIGIDHHRLNQLFSPFTQIDSSITRKYGGTGLGLAICRQLTELMNGRIWVDSEINKGSQFHFTCKIKPNNGSNSQRWPSYNKLKGMQALVVDDNAMAREVLADILSSLGIEVTTVADGYAALDELESATSSDSPYDVVFLDWNIPAINGVETAKKIENNINIKPPVAMLMVTAYDVDRVETDAHQANIKKIISKPVDASGIHDSLAEIFFQEKIPRPTSTNRELNLLGSLDLSVLRDSRILVVDDSALNREVAREFLVDVGIKVSTASNGEQAIRMIKQANYDLVLMDVQMPVMDGLTATQIIREDNQYKQLPIIAMTAHASPDDYKRSLDSGMNDHLNKPIDHQLLYRTITRWIDASASINQFDADEPDSYLSFSEQDKTSEPTSTEKEDTFPIELPGFDTSIGLKRHNHKADLYLRMLNLFYKEYRNIEQEIREEKSQGNFTYLHRLFHTIKSSAASLGEATLSELASTLEKLMHNLAVPVDKELDEKIEQELALFFTQFNHSLASLTQLQVEESSTITSSDVDDSKRVKQLIHQLNELLEDDNAAAEKLIHMLKATSATKDHNDALESILLEIQDVDYFSASKKLKILAQQIG
ncbi:multi-sensor hybrid histidine kinase [Shewanella woodyi ATCC 51908]|uniref:histidine kinase n=2 Tax=Shewanella woodyi TaxID=60961 RepID=B1KEX3_SHEWM|nr:multi-sensor hybrid histidine kinase [Shewanella woodyi ATCC 51908]